jgi:hypothetical protein
MVATVKTTCATCGTVELPAESARLTIPTAPGETQVVLEFSCPACRELRADPVSERATLLLMRAGVPVGATAQPFVSRVSQAHPDDAP